MSERTLYLRRVAVMLGLAMPSAIMLLAILELSGGTEESVYSIAVGAAGLVYIWGVITGTVVSLAHTSLLRVSEGGTTFSILGGALLGAIGGGCTPTLFTGLFEPAAIGLGSFAGLVYGSIVAFSTRRYRPTPE